MSGRLSWVDQPIPPFHAADDDVDEPGAITPALGSDEPTTTIDPAGEPTTLVANGAEPTSLVEEPTPGALDAPAPVTVTVTELGSADQPRQLDAEPPTTQFEVGATGGFGGLGGSAGFAGFDGAATVADVPVIRTAETASEPMPSGFQLDAGDEMSIWTITARVNAGVTAHVYRAMDAESLTPTDVALKVLLPQYAHGRQDEMVHEVEVMSRLTLGHPHLMPSSIARRITSGPYAGGVVIVMPWADGNLREYVLAAVRNQPLPDGGRWLGARAMCEALAGVADGLAQLHELQAAHGDVKPDNILLVDGVWKLGDFGLTRPLEGSYVVSAPGTLSYTPPEEARSQLDPASELKRRPAGDVWALGVTLHFVITGGRFPMPGINPDERLAAVRAGDIRVRSEIQPPALRELLVDGLLVDDRDLGASRSHQRRLTAAQAANALYRIAAGEEATGTHRAVGPVGPEDALARYRRQCEQVARQTTSLWRELGPWDGKRAVTRTRSRGALDTMLANRLAATEPPPELRPRKSVAARALGIRSPDEKVRTDVRRDTVHRGVPVRLHDWQIYWRLLGTFGAGMLVSAFLLALLTGIEDITQAPMTHLILLFLACAGVGVAVLGASFPEPAYIRRSWAGRVMGPVIGGVLAAGGIVFLLAMTPPLDPLEFRRPNLFPLVAVLPAAGGLALFGWYVGGVLASRLALGEGVMSRHLAAPAPIRAMSAGPPPAATTKIPSQAPYGVRPPQGYPLPNAPGRDQRPR